ncbi:HPF/RaiA family ribosome-associated protein [Acidovorax sp. Q11]
MQILFRTRHPEAALMRDAVERRVRFAFRRLNALVPRAEIKLDDINGPRGGPDKRCQIALRTDGAGAVVVSSVARDWRCALDEALASAARHLLRTWRRNSTRAKQRRHGMTKDATRLASREQPA